MDVRYLRCLNMCCTRLLLVTELEQEKVDSSADDVSDWMDISATH